MDSVSGNIIKITQASTAAQENTGKLMENAILQAVIKPQDITPPNPVRDSRTVGTDSTSNSSCETNWTVLANKQFWHTTTP